MNYFELLEMPVRLQVDQQELKKKYLALARKNHPDFFAHSGKGAQEEALEMTAQLNKALKTFQDADATLRYVLILKGQMTEGEKYTLDPEFLMEVMELNEELMEATGEGRKEVETKIKELENKIHADVAEILEHYQEGVTPPEALLRIKEYYYRKKYLDRISGRTKDRE
jgi:molecular chaperone HscB